MKANHISVCICTFKRPELLTYLLQRLNYQQTEDLFTYSVVVADNDPAQSARQTVEAFLPSANMPVKYCHESEQNIAMTRNKSLQNADGEFIAFIDDDEYPVDDWLLQLFKTRLAYEVAGVLGPVKPYFQQKPPKWAEKGRFFDRPSYPTGYVLNFSQARTGNVLFKAEILAGTDEAFRTEFDTAGEDIDFFRRMMDKGFKFVWCDEAVAHELVPNSRCTRRYLLRRALLRGSNFSKHPAHRLKNAMKSLIAVPCYLISLPFLILFGEHVFLRYLIKLLDHVSRLLSYAGLPVLTQRQT